MRGERASAERLPGLIAFILVMVAMSVWGLVAMKLTVFSGNYAFKALALVAIMGLALQRANHMAMLMFLPFLWMPIKFARQATLAMDILLPIGIAYVFVAWVVSLLTVPRGEGLTTRGRAVAVKGIYYGMLVLALLGVVNAVGAGHYWNQMGAFVTWGLAFVLALRSPLSEVVLRRMFIAFLVAVSAFLLGWGVMAVVAGGPNAMYRFLELRTGIPGYLNRYARVALVVYAFAFGIAASTLPRRTRYTAIFCGIVPSALALLIAVSKIGLAVAPPVTIAALLLTNRKRAALWVALALVVAGLLLVVAEPGYVAAVVERFSGLSRAADVRSMIRREAWEITLRHPLFGVGPGQYSYYSGLRVMFAHNGPLHFAAEMGFPGLALYVALTAAVAYRLFVVGRRVKDPLRKAVVQGGQLAFLAMVVAVQANGILHTKEAVAFMGVMGLAYLATSPAAGAGKTGLSEGAP